MAISSPLKSKIPKSSTTTVKKFQTILFNRTRVKKEIFQNKTILQNRRVENERRVQAEEELEAPDIARKSGGPAQLIAGSAKGFFERILGFLGYVTAGWIINNLPTWISMGKEFIARTRQMGKILGNFIKNTTDIFKNFTGLLGASLTNIMTFDFLDTSGRVGTAFEELQLSVDNWGTGFEDAIKLITTPLTEGISSGEDARPTGTQNTDEGAYERTAPYSGSDGSTTSYSSTASMDLAKSAERLKKQRLDTSRFGRDGCVFAVNEIYKGAGMTPPWGTGVYVPTARSILVKKGFSQVGVKNAKPGDIVIMSDTHPTLPWVHIGIVSTKGTVIHNSSTNRALTNDESFSSLVSRYVKIEVFRDPESDNPPPAKTTSNPSKALPAQSLSKNQPQQNLMGTSSSSSSSGSGDVGPWRPLLNLIASKESGGNYEAMAPNKTLPGATKMTIADVARKSTGAVGKYQQLPQFLVERSKKAGLNPDKDLFSPANQDSIAAKVNIGMERFGDSWLAGKYSTEKFMQGLSQEFAVVPNAYGAFAYPGQSSSMTPQQVKASLEQVKKGGGSQTSSPTQAQTQPYPTTTKSTKQPAQTQSSPTQTQAQITPTGTQQNTQANQSLTPERRGQTVIISQNPSQPQQQTMPYGGGGSSGGGSSSQTNEFSLLNIFMKNKLLLDLAYL